MKIILCETNSILFSKNYWKLSKMNARFRKNIKNKGNAMFDSIRNSTFVTSYLHLKSFVSKPVCNF